MKAGHHHKLSWRANIQQTNKIKGKNEKRKYIGGWDKFVDLETKYYAFDELI